jgi:hypothetical protein
MTALLPAARADKALLVGVNKYPRLEGADLRGCVPDAQLMAGVLKKYGFQTKIITDSQATRQDILTALKEMQQTVAPNERFVFYFAGHGTRASEGRSVILPHDAQEGSENNDIPSLVLFENVKAVNARSKTVLLDSCFSGGMLRAKALLKLGIKTRFYQRRDVERFGDGSKDLKVVRQDDNKNLNPGDNTVCYFVATRANEQAAEDEMSGERHGVFTYFLSQRLAGSRDTWGEVQKTVTGKVAEHLDDTQHPTLSPAFVDREVFGGPNTPPPPPPPDKKTNLWDEFNGDYANPSMILMKMIPDSAQAIVNKTEIQFTAAVGNYDTTKYDAFLVIVERGTSGKYQRLFPMTNTVGDARVTPNRNILIPTEPNERFVPDAQGFERIKAILYLTPKKGTVPERVQYLMTDIPSIRDVSTGEKSGLSRAALQEVLSRRDLRLTTKKEEKEQFYTSDIQFEVVGTGTAAP